MLDTFKVICRDVEFGSITSEQAQARVRTLREEADRDRAINKRFVDNILYTIDNPDGLDLDSRIEFGTQNAEDMRVYRLRQARANGIIPDIEDNEFFDLDPEFLSAMQGSSGDFQAHFDDSDL